MGEVKKIQVEAKHGRKQNQKMKPYVVLQYLMKKTDKNHLGTAYDRNTWFFLATGYSYNKP